VEGQKNDGVVKRAMEIRKLRRQQIVEIKEVRKCVGK